MKDVFLIRSRLTGKRSLLDRLEKLLEAAGLEFVRPRDLVGIKLSFGERGNTAFLRPLFVRRVVDTLKARGAKPFLTDSNTLYHGHRTNSVDHLVLAEEHGFGLTQVGAPVIMADGLRSESYLETEVNLKHFRRVKVGSVVGEMDALVSLAHFKGHLACAFGGTLKNIGMGLGSRSMKQLMHSGSVHPEFSDRTACTGCARCATVCQYGAIHIESAKAHFTYERCVGCAECIPACPEEALKILWAEKPEVLGEKIAETTYGVLHRLKERYLFVNFLLDITPDCDCFPYNDDPIVPDIGILAARDPVAIDQASVDLLNAEESIAASQIGRRAAREDKLAALCPEVNWQRQLEYAEEIGLGSRRYRLVEM